jgi:acyl carrier protein
MQTADIKLEIRNFVANNFMLGRKEELQDDAALFGGILDSSGAIELVMFLQDRFNIAVEDDEVAVPENFGSVNHVVEFVEKKLHSKAAATK